MPQVPSSLGAQAAPATRRKRTKLGRYVGDITFLELSQYFHLPAHQACLHLGVGLTMIKRVSQRYGIKRWPYRRHKALRDAGLLPHQALSAACRELVIPGPGRELPSELFSDGEAAPGGSDVVGEAAGHAADDVVGDNPDAGGSDGEGDGFTEKVEEGRLMASPPPQRAPQGPPSTSEIGKNEPAHPSDAPCYTAGAGHREHSAAASASPRGPATNPVGPDGGAGANPSGSATPGRPARPSALPPKPSIDASSVGSAGAGQQPSAPTPPPPRVRIPGMLDDESAPPVPQLSDVLGVRPLRAGTRTHSLAHSSLTPPPRSAANRQQAELAGRFALAQRLSPTDEDEGYNPDRFDGALASFGHLPASPAPAALYPILKLSPCRARVVPAAGHLRRPSLALPAGYDPSSARVASPGADPCAWLGSPPAPRITGAAGAARGAAAAAFAAAVALVTQGTRLAQDAAAGGVSDPILAEWTDKLLAAVAEATRGAASASVPSGTDPLCVATCPDASRHRQAPLFRPTLGSGAASAFRPYVTPPSPLSLERPHTLG